MSILNQILAKYPESLEIFKIKGYENVNYALVHTPSELIVFNLDTIQQSCVFNGDYSVNPLSDIVWGLSLSFLELVDYLACAGIVTIDMNGKPRKLEDLMLLMLSSKKHLTSTIELVFDWAFAISGVFELIWTQPKTKESTNILNDKTKQKEVNQDGYIYVVQLDSFVKVGFSRNVEQRMKQYQTSNLNVNVIKKFKGTLSQELDFHRQTNGGSEKYLDTPDNVIASLKSFLNAK